MRHRLSHGVVAPWLTAILVLAGCGEPESGSSVGDATLAPDAGAALPSVAGHSDRTSERANDAALHFLGAAQTGPATDLTDAAAIEPYVPPRVTYPSARPTRPFMLSEVGLYRDTASKTLAPDLIFYEPTYSLWSDGASKQRYLRLPAEAHIDNTDADHWQLPVGAVLFKEFRSGVRLLETRVLARTGTGPRDYFFGAFVWRDDGSDAELSWDGASDVGESTHDVPSVTQCGTCHNGEPGRVLGMSAVQTPTAAGARLLLPIDAPYQVPGDHVQARALGYLHANCGHCHNPQGSARPDTDLALRLSVQQRTVEQTSAYLSSVGVALQSFQGKSLDLRIAAGEPERSGLFFRMRERGPRTQMPPIATEQADAEGLAAIADFIVMLAAQPEPASSTSRIIAHGSANHTIIPPRRPRVR
jgi:hypothetical protein